MSDETLVEDFVKELKATVPWLLAAAVAVGGFYGARNWRAARRAAASEAFVNAYTAEELEEAVAKHGSSDAGGVLKLRLAKKYYDAGRYQEAKDIYAALSGPAAPDGYADIPAVGVAMDLAVGARQTWVMMDLLTKQGDSKIVERCSYPLTGIACVKRIYTDLATFECTPHGLRLVDAVPGLTREVLEGMVKLPLAA